MRQVHWSVMVLLSVSLGACAWLVYTDRLSSGFFVTALAGVMGWLLPSPLEKVEPKEEQK